ncbi:hypothetical protein M5D96_006390 [Drosophila gunungcola]|uniref:Uncharacterized protein n=1 Tax=Drosophila gunungcola TaxID=103775 RepID=A0A9Q0BQ34_9MUSC|nr:hypothetical protein M5D96_006390 [Drosophila gunungcola]
MAWVQLTAHSTGHGQGHGQGHSVAHSLHRGQCYGANGGDAESHHNCGGSCRNVHVKSNPYQCEAGYGHYSVCHTDDDTDDGIIYMDRTHFYHEQDGHQAKSAGAKCSYLAEEELASDYDEDVPAIDLSKATSVETFATRVQSEQVVNADGLPVTVTTIL